MKLPGLKTFKNDLKIVVMNEIQNKNKGKGIKNGVMFMFMLFAYILSKPFFTYYKGRCERKFKILELKKKGEFII